MKLTERGISQVVFGYLPDQTVDLNNRVWKVKRWSNPNYQAIDQEVVRNELLHAIAPWSGRDNGLEAKLRSGAEVLIISPSRSGVEVEPFPRLYICKDCSRLEKAAQYACKCGSHKWAPFPFVSYHSCGLLREPWIDICKTHRQVRVNNPKSNNARDLRFTCPVCNGLVQDGFRWINCECGTGTIDYNVHRAGTVFSPHATVMVNPPDQELARRLRSPSGQSATLQWILNGMREDTPLEEALSVDILVDMFIAKGYPEARARKMAQAAAEQSEGLLTTSQNDTALSPEARQRAEGAALRLAYATAGGRGTLEKLLNRSAASMASRYAADYPIAVRAAGLESVELLDDFPVLTAFFGYTRGDDRASQAQLRWYKDERGRPQLFGLRANTEALMFTLDPVRVASWLHSQGYLEEAPSGKREARLAILEACDVEAIGDPDHVVDASTALLRLVHSCSHRMIRTVASFAGTDRDGLAEYLVPLHLTFVIYARSTSDFKLGGLQALFENDLAGALREFMRAETRCPLDPGCIQTGGACMACLHTGEPSCRLFNQFLARPVLFGPTGYLSNLSAPAGKRSKS